MSYLCTCVTNKQYIMIYVLHLSKYNCSMTVNLCRKKMCWKLKLARPLQRKFWFRQLIRLCLTQFIFSYKRHKFVIKTHTFTLIIEKKVNKSLTFAYIDLQLKNNVNIWWYKQGFGYNINVNREINWISTSRGSGADGYTVGSFLIIVANVCWLSNFAGSWGRNVGN